jgi:EAL domain-containing protein (putative c-di-GMP-specific phosphodiesterase class I)
VAEGVETSEQLVAVRDLEFGAGQGFLLGRPDASVAKTHVDVFELENGAFEPPLAEVLVASPAAEHDGIDEIDLISEERRALFMPPARTTFGREPGPA